MYPLSNQTIQIKGARTHNLKNISIDIPKNKFIVITGVSGSGKSSLAFDTLYADARRRYIESLSSYARQFLERLAKPDVDKIINISPAIAIKQKTITRNSRSTVGTTTEIYDFMRMLFARVGKVYAEDSNAIVKKYTASEVVRLIITNQKCSSGFICFTIKGEEKVLAQSLDSFYKKGFTRVWLESEVVRISENREKVIESLKKDKQLMFVIDRFRLDGDEDTQTRIAEAVNTAFAEGNGRMQVLWEDNSMDEYSEFFEHNGKLYAHPTPQLFSFNSALGACTVCEGFGKAVSITQEGFFKSKTSTVKERLQKLLTYPPVTNLFGDFLKMAKKKGISLKEICSNLTEEQRNLLWNGTDTRNGLHFIFDELTFYSRNDFILRGYVNQFKRYSVCENCQGARLKKEALRIKIGGKNIAEVSRMTIEENLVFFIELNLSSYDREVGKSMLEEIVKRLNYLKDVGLGYLTIDREARTLSGGESQRINLASSLGSSLVNTIYILDEPSIGLHQRDSEKLIKVINKLKNIGNTVIVVEHDRDIIKAADIIVDIGPRAGTQGGQVMFNGSLEQILKDPQKSQTAKYLSDINQIPLPKQRRSIDIKKVISIKKANKNNLKNINTDIPLNAMTCITGVSGSGKSTLVYEELYESLLWNLESEESNKRTDINRFTGGIHLIDQSSTGRSSRSNPATYIKAFDDIREIFSKTNYAKTNFITPSMFSFNIPGGRCESCQGEGKIIIEMQFLADIQTTCESCEGRRYKGNILMCTFQKKNISEVLDMTVAEALSFFKDHKPLTKKLKVLNDVGLGYIQLGQSMTTLSGGEAQRLKLATFISSASTKNALFIFDEPTTGLHFDDITKLIKCFNKLISQENTLVVVEHNLEIIKQADWVIDLGPEAGDKGGNIVGVGTPEQIAKIEASYTGQELKKILPLAHSKEKEI